MKLAVIIVLCALVAGDVVHLKAAKAKLLGRLSGRHHKRGVPAYKLGYDIPTVTHSVVKPLVVSYPPTASVTAVKVPLVHPLLPRHPVAKFPVPHPHIHKFHSTRTVIAPNPDQHFHHHHHHVAPRPVVPIVPAPVPAPPLIPIGQPTATITHPIPAPAPPVVVPPTPVLPHPTAIYPSPTSLLPAPVAHLPSPVHFLSSDPFRVKPIVPAAAFPIQQAPLSPLIPFTQQYPYILRAGNAVQTSVFATYPRIPYVNYQSPLIPLTGPAGPTGPVFLDRPEANIPQVHLAPEAGTQEVIEHHAPPVVVEPTHLHPAQAAPQPTVHLQSAQPVIPIEHDGWSPVPAPAHDLSVHDAHYPQDSHHFTQEQGSQVFEHHDEYQHQLQHHIQQQIEQAQYEQHLNNQHQLGNEYGIPQNAGQDFNSHDFAHGQFGHHEQDFGQGQQFAPHGQDFGQGQHIGPHGQDLGQGGQFGHGQDLGQGQFAHGQDFGQQFGQHGPDFGQGHQGQFGQGQDLGQGQFAHGQDFGQGHQGQFGQGQDFGQGQQFGQDSNLGQQPAQEYGAPAEGRSGEGEAEPQRFHNHIPLGLQLPLDRPLEHFR